MMNMLKNCRCCGKEFIPKNNASQYCSIQCKRQHYNIKANEINATRERTTKCTWCGETFTAIGRFKYCSLVCNLMAKGKINGIARKPDKPVKKKPIKSIEEVARLSREAGLSYGQYMVMHREEE